MTLIKTLPDNPHLADVFKKFPRGVKPLLEFHDILLREQSPLSIAERELIAAYVSGLNGCYFCFGAHVRIAKEFGIEPSLLESLLDDIDSSKIEERMKPLLRYVKVLTKTPSKITRELIDNIHDSGWDDHAIYDAASVCALFNFMNRIVEGMGVVSAPPINKESREVSSPTSYQDFGHAIGVI